MANEINKIQLNTNYQLGNVSNKPEDKAKMEKLFAKNKFDKILKGFN